MCKLTVRINQATSTFGEHITNKQAFKEFGLPSSAGSDAIQMGVARCVWEWIWQESMTANSKAIFSR